ncbi:RNA-binding S4 domain-containing protein [soil metagenome]
MITEASGKVRIDKWLWAVRLYKTRALAAEACVKGRVKMSEIAVKAGRNIKPGDIIELHRGPWHQYVKVLQVSEKRMAASISPLFCIDITPPEQLEKLKLHQLAMASWHLKNGAGRPTKKDRRDIDEYMGDW